MNAIPRLFNSWPKRVGIAAIAVFAAVALPFVSSGAADAVKLESSLGVANVTAGDTKYQPSVNAKYDQVIKVQLYYHNVELPDSGKLANNVKVKFDVPTKAGKTQKVTGTVSADNAKSITSVAQINLDRSDAYLQYIPGSAVWRHNTGERAQAKQNWKEQIISDNVVYGSSAVRLENQKPCFEYAATVTILVRVMVPGVSVDKQVQKASESGKWSTSNTAKPGETLKYMISYKNTGNTEQKQVILRDNLPPRMTLVPGTTVLTTKSHPNGVKVKDTVTQGGVNAGNFGPGAVAYLVFQVKIADAKDLACGVTEFRNVGVARPQGMNEYYNTAVTKVTKECAPEKPKPTPVYACEQLKVTKTGVDRQIKAVLTTTAKDGATFVSATYDFGDGTAPVTTDKKTVNHTFAKYGTFRVTAKVTFNVNGKSQTVTSTKCADSVTFTQPQKPEEPKPEPTPVYSCESLEVKELGNRRVRVILTAPAKDGASFVSATYNFGDGSATLTTDKKTVEYTYSKDGTYNITASVLFSVNGKKQTINSANCAATVTFTTPEIPVTPEEPEVPVELPHTGAESVVAIFVAVSALAAIGYNYVVARRS